MLIKAMLILIKNKMTEMRLIIMTKRKKVEKLINFHST